VAKALPYEENGQVTGYMIFCPACKCGHLFNTVAGSNGVGGQKPVWTFNGNQEKPTFRASMLVMTGHFCAGQPQPPDCWLCKRVANKERDFSPCCRCHSYVTDGRIEFLGDCSHELRGQTVDLPDF
jgi:hypothetical protein